MDHKECRLRSPRALKARSKIGLILVDENSKTGTEEANNAARTTRRFADGGFSDLY